jgi:hypothetical protein
MVVEAAVRTMVMPLLLPVDLVLAEMVDNPQLQARLIEEEGVVVIPQ